MSKILVIEDDREMAGVLKTILSVNKIESTHAYSAATSIELLKRESFDLILCDMMLPDMLGTDLLQKVRTELKLTRIPFIFLSAFCDPWDVRIGMNAGADDYLAKPFSADQLVQTIRARLSIKSDMEKAGGNIPSLLGQNFNHEYVNPLNGILNAAKLIDIENEGLNNPHLDLLSKIITASGLRMLNNTKKLVMYSMMQEGTLNVRENCKSVSPMILVRDAITLLEKEYTERSLYFNTYMEDMPKIFCNAMYTEFVISELMGNALKHQSGSDAVVVRLRKTSGGKCELEVRNSIVPSMRFAAEHIAPFHKFFPGLSVSGFGLGLYLVQQLCRRLDYDLIFEQTSRELIVRLLFS